MSTDNTTLNNTSGGDTVRDLARQSGTVKTQVVQIDAGGASTNAEVLITAGQHLSAVSFPVVIASDQSAVPAAISSSGLGGSAGTPLYTTGGSAGSNAAAGLTGSAVPASADYSGFNDGTGHLIGTSPTTPLPISVNAANFIFSSLNSTSTQLASGATFTGTIETAVNQPEISLLLTSDQPVTLTINQFIDAGGVYAVQPIVFFVLAGVEFSRSFPINGNYLQLMVKNTGLATTTTLNLNTAYGTINSADSSGNTPVSAAENSVVGSITSTQSVTIPTVGYSTIGVDISGTWTGSLTPEVTINGTIWYPIEFVDTGGGLLGTTFSANNLAQCNAAGMSQFRLRGNTVATGTANIILRASAMPAVVALNESLPQGANQIGSVAQSGTWNIGSITTMPSTPVTGTFWQATQPVSLATNTPTLQSGSTTAVTQATAANLNATVSIAAAQTLATVTTVGSITTLPALVAGSATIGGVKLIDTAGTNVGTIKAASTAVAATDTAVAVGLHPTSPLPTGANTIGAVNIAAAQTLATVTTVGTLSAITAGPAIASGLYVRNTDGTTLAGVTAASTAAAAATGGLVVSLSPNSPMPATTSANQAVTNINVNATGALVAVKASAGNLFGFSILNGTAAVAYLSFWNVATGSVTLGTTAPTCVFALAASATLTVPPSGMSLMNSATAISFAAVTAYNGATTASVTGSIFYK